MPPQCGKGACEPHLFQGAPSGETQSAVWSANSGYCSNGEKTRGRLRAFLGKTVRLPAPASGNTCGFQV